MMAEYRSANEASESRLTQEQEQDQTNTLAMANMLQGLNIHQNQILTNGGDEKKCKHKLFDASYGDIKQFSEYFDTTRRGDACQGILDLMRKFLKEQDVVRIWRACRGGESPAMGFINYISCTQATTISQFMNWLPNESQAYKHVKEIMMKEKYPNNTIMSKIDYKDLEEISKDLSVQMDPKNSFLQFTWKDVANKGKLDRNTIKALDAPQHQALETKSMTTEMVNFLGGSKPGFKIGSLAKHLKDIDRIDVIENCTLFKSCLDKECIILVDEEEKEEDIEQITSLC